jgi:anti-sigma factor (TIGR02949 family)
MSDTHDMGCEQALKRLVEFVDRELPESEHDSVEQHLRICRNCCSRMEFESQLKERLSTLSTEDAPSTTRDRVRDLIKRF